MSNINNVKSTKLFIEYQGYNSEQNISYQDNKSTTLLQENGKKKIE